MPRTGGGLPSREFDRDNTVLFAPHRRGSTVGIRGTVIIRNVCPAQAGVYPEHPFVRGKRGRLPRTGGGLPIQCINPQDFQRFAPHRRGSTPIVVMPAGLEIVCPAQAGVYPA